MSRPHRPIQNLRTGSTTATAGRLARCLGALPSNPVIAARYRYLTTRAENPLSDGQARAAIAAALLRWLHVTATQRISWDPAMAGAGELPTAAK